MRRLAIVPSDPIAIGLKRGYAESRLKGYFNPTSFFDEVYVLSPLEKTNPDLLGMIAINTPDRFFKPLVLRYKIDIIRAYGGYWACDLACRNKVSGIPVVVSVHDPNPNNLHNSIKNADFVFCTSESVRKMVNKRFKKRDRILLLPNRVDLSLMHPVPKNELTEGNFFNPDS